MSADQVDRRIATGRWLLVQPHVYLAVDHQHTDEVRVRAAGLWAGEPATVSGLAAAWWHGLWPDPPQSVGIAVPVRRRPRSRPGIRIQRRNLAEIDRVGVRGLWLTAVPLTALDAAVELGQSGARLLDRALQQRVGIDALHRAHCRNLGRRGSAAAGRLLAAAADRAASAAERLAITLLRKANLTGWRLHYGAGGYELDLAFPEQHVAIEIDGWAYHHDTAAFHTDRRRQNDLVLAGWTVLRFTWHDLTRCPGRVIADIRRAVDRR